METLTKHFREITRAAFARHGFQQGEVISHWAEIAGAELADAAAPERIKWPRGAGEEAQKSGGTLVIRAAPGRALDIQYEAPRIMARINSYFGYGAVARIKVLQGREPPRRPPRHTPRPDGDAILVQKLEGFDDGPLKTALEGLAKGIGTARASSPQDN